MKFIQRNGVVGDVDFVGDEARILRNGEVVVDWTSGGVIEDVPQGGGYTLEVRSGGNVTSEGLSIGTVVAGLGQSNMVAWTRDETPFQAAPDTYLLQPDGTWGPVVGAGAIALTSTLRQQLDVPVAFIQSAVGGSALREGVDASYPNNYWLNTSSTSIYNAAVKQLESVGGSKVEFVLWGQGETDAARPEGYADALNELFDRIANDYGYPQIFIQELGRRGGTNAFDGVRSEQNMVAVERDDTEIGAITRDLDLRDPVHLDRTSIAETGLRMASSILDFLSIDFAPALSTGTGDQDSAYLYDRFNEYHAYAGDDTVYGGSERDVIVAGEGNDFVSAKRGNDIIFANEGNDSIWGGEGLDLVSGGIGDDSLSGDDGDDLLEGNDGSDELSGGTGRDFIDGGAGADFMIGGSGDDQFVVDQQNEIIIEELNGGYDTLFYKSSYIMTEDSEIELVKAYTKYILPVEIVGNSLDNTITTERGNDTLNGGGGNDTLKGGSGNDIYYVDSFGDQVIESRSGGSDVVYTTSSFNLGAASEVETLILDPVVTGGVSIGGSASVNRIYAGVGDDTLNGGGGADLLYGLGGDDLYIVSDTQARIFETENGGLDTVRSSATYRLGANIENLVLASARGANGSGNELDNRITGDQYANVLNGLGGRDTLVGGGGNDTFYVDGATDELIEEAGGGTDTVYTTVSYKLAADLEYLRVDPLVAGGLALTGNAGQNRLYGGGGNDTLTGVGANDLLYGGGGNDVYYVRGGGDRVYESEYSGSDTVFTSISYTLAAGQEVEILRVEGATGPVTLSGNEFANSIYGGGADDKLAGGAGNDVLVGGGGADDMSGGAGDDRFTVADAGDIVREVRLGGHDIVFSSVNYALTAGQEVEELRANSTTGLNLAGNDLVQRVLGGAGADTLRGGGDADTLLGYAGNDILNGGEGVDRLYGGAGDDRFIVDNQGDVVLEADREGVDTVESSVSHTLRANVENLILTGAGAINASGNGQGNILTGNAAANVLSGAGGADTLTGGMGTDRLYGGGDKDTFVFAAHAESGLERDVFTSAHILH